jgi:DNA adenine methylase
MIVQPVKWHGGKSYLAKWIHSLAPVGYTHRNIVFGGGLGEFWNWPHEGISEAVNDAYSQLTNFWRTLQDEQLFVNFCREVEAMPFSQAEWEESDPSTPVGFFVHFRQSRQGLGKDYATPTRRTRRGMNEQVSAWQTAVDGLPDCCQRLRRVEIRNRHFRDFIKTYDHPKALFYCDPPYVHSTRSTGGGEYSHEITEADHAELLDILAHMSGRFMLSGYRCEIYDQAAAKYGWTRHEKEIDNKASSQKVKPKKVECIWAN